MYLIEHRNTVKTVLCDFHRVVNRIGGVIVSMLIRSVGDSWPGSSQAKNY